MISQSLIIVLVRDGVWSWEGDVDDSYTNFNQMAHFQPCKIQNVQVRSEA